MEDRKHFYELLTSENIVCASMISSRDTLLDEMLKLLKRHHPALDLDEAAAEVTAREALFPTVVAPGLAVPHARICGLKEPLLALVCTPNGADFRSELGDVKVTILLLTPVEEPDLHLQMLSEIARTFGAPAMIDKVAACAASEQVLKLFSSNGQDIENCLTAGDLIDTPSAILRETGSLSGAIRAFATTGSVELVVPDR